MRTFWLFTIRIRPASTLWLSTNNLALTDPLATEMDEFLRKILTSIAGVDIFAVPTAGTPIHDFVTERASLK
jgi:hypothetical protein